MLQSASYCDFAGNDVERTYHAFILGLLVSLQGRYQVKSNRESGFGRADVLLIPKNPQELGLILEFKSAESLNESNLDAAASQALEQITKNKYENELKSHGVSNILALGLAFKQKQVRVKSSRIC